MHGVLSGVRVLDLAEQSGALAGRLLAGLGADVVLLEPPDNYGRLRRHKHARFKFSMREDYQRFSF